MSSSYAGRYRERRRALERSFGDTHTVATFLDDELRSRAEKRGITAVANATTDELLLAMEQADA
jgi:hypothetical protein